ncbi:hypothetical protein [Embleya sp. NPDC001921]
MHAFQDRTVTDVPVDARRVAVLARRRLGCPASTYPHVTFRKQVHGVLDRYQRRTARLLVDDDWFDQAFAYTTVRVLGVVAPLTRRRDRKRSHSAVGYRPPREVHAEFEELRLAA